MESGKGLGCRIVHPGPLILGCCPPISSPVLYVEYIVHSCKIWLFCLSGLLFLSSLSVPWRTGCLGWDTSSCYIAPELAFSHCCQFLVIGHEPEPFFSICLRANAHSDSWIGLPQVDPYIGKSQIIKIVLICM